MADFDYNFNIKRLTWMLLPPILRKQKAFRWTQAFLNPLHFLHEALLIYIGEKRYEIPFNGQVVNLERLLNEKFNSFEYRAPQTFEEARILRARYDHDITIDNDDSLISKIIIDGFTADSLFLFQEGDKSVYKGENGEFISEEDELGIFFFDDDDQAIAVQEPKDSPEHNSYFFGEVSQFNYDFSINIPYSLDLFKLRTGPEEEEEDEKKESRFPKKTAAQIRADMVATINQYKLAGKSFIIQEYDDKPIETNTEPEN